MPINDHGIIESKQITMSDSDEVFEGELKNFCLQLAYYSQFKEYRGFTTGSRVEIEDNELSIQVYCDRFPRMRQRSAM